MKYRIHLTILAVLLINSFWSNAQDNQKPFMRFDVFQELNYSVEYDMASYLNNSMLGHYYSGKQIDQELKDENLARLNANNNIFGSTMDMSFQYRNLPSKLFNQKHLGYSFAIEWHSISELNFTKDAFSLMFYGNKMFAGENANLDNVISRNINYYQIKAGLFKQNRDKHIEYGFQLGLNLGNQFSQYGSNEASFYTDSLGRYVTLEGEFLYNQSAYIGSNYGNIQGVGSGLDLYYQWYKPKQWKLRLDLRNAGFIWWNNQTNNYNEDEVLSFHGIEIDNVFQMPDPIISTTINDSLSDYINQNSTEASMFMLTPMEISISYLHFINESVSASAKVRHKFFSLYLPCYELGIQYYFKDKYRIGGSLNYGGYTKLNVGIDFQMTIKTKFVIELQSRYLSGLAPHSFSGMGAFLILNYKL